jgi:transcriptional regulator with PAS, ATPase and Fis domain
MRERRREPRLSDFVRTKSAAVRTLLETLGKVVDHDVSVLLLGESGSGKDHLAKAIHACSQRRDAAFVAIDCASIPADLFESELFGYEKGTFTDATSRKIGRLEAAGRGTVYFDEIGALAPTLQAKLLRAMQDRSFTRLGGAQPVPFMARVISSSSGDASSLRRDLLYRINVVTLHVPPLRERMEDLVPLVRELLARRKRAVREDALAVLRSYHWPGNVRELQNVIERAVIVEEGDVITPDSLPPFEGDLVETASRSQWTLEELESRYIREVLRQTRCNYSRTAAILGINRKTLLEKRRKYGIE